MEEEILPHILTVTPLFGGHLPFGNYYHDRIGNISLTTRSQRSFDSLFVDDIWPGSIYIADYLNKYPFLCYSKRILELGAGAALPSMVAGKLFCQYLVISDYPKKDILDNIQQVVEKNNLTNIPYSIIGYIWGDDIQPLIAPLSSQPSLSQPLTDMNSSPSSNDSMLFDLIILAEVLWKDTYPQHRNLLFTIKNCLSKKKFQLLDLPPHLLHHELSPFQSILQSYPIALVSFIHRPTPSGDHTPQHDLEFFDIAFHEYQLCSLLLESREDSVDSGDIVYLYCLYHQDCTTTTTSNDTSMNTNPF